MKKIAYVGIDYHVKTISVAVMISGNKDFYDTTEFKNTEYRKDSIRLV